MKIATLILLLIGSTTFAQYTAIPDPNFEQALIDLGYDDVLDGQVLTENVENLIELDIMSSEITDLTGIQDFSNLEYLNCADNNLSFLNITQNLFLKNLDTRGNPLISLDVTHNSLLESLQIWFCLMPTINLNQNPNLTHFSARSSQLTSLDFSNNPLLESVQVRNSQIQSINVDNNPLIWALELGGNQLSNLNISNLPNLTTLLCSSNSLTELNLSENPLLDWVIVSNNQLSHLDIRNGNNSNWDLIATDNQNLICIFVDDKNNIPSRWEVDPNATYVETEAECDALGIEDFDEISFEIYPNPTEDIFIVDSKTIIKSVSIYDVSGKLVKDFTAQPEYSVSGLSSGIYIIKIDGESGNTIQKLIVQ